MTIHVLKIEEKYYIDILRGVKTFELRKNDRDYKVGDLIQFEVKQEYIKDIPDVSSLNKGIYYTLQDDIFKIVYILKDAQRYGLDKDYCILGIKQVEIIEINTQNQVRG